MARPRWLGPQAKKMIAESEARLARLTRRTWASRMVDAGLWVMYYVFFGWVLAWFLVDVLDLDRVRPVHPPGES